MSIYRNSVNFLEEFVNESAIKYLQCYGIGSASGYVAGITTTATMKAIHCSEESIALLAGIMKPLTFYLGKTISYCGFHYNRHEEDGKRSEDIRKLTASTFCFLGAGSFLRIGAHYILMQKGMDETSAYLVSNFSIGILQFLGKSTLETKLGLVKWRKNN